MKNPGLKEEEQMEIKYRPLGIVKEVLESLGAEVSYAYEDLVFVKHNHFLLQFGDVGEELYFYKNTEIKADESAKQFATVAQAVSERGIALSHRGEYNLAEKDDGTITIEFFESSAE